jgi:hypothetical protein
MVLGSSFDQLDNYSAVVVAVHSQSVVWAFWSMDCVLHLSMHSADLAVLGSARRCHHPSLDRYKYWDGGLELWAVVTMTMAFHGSAPPTSVVFGLDDDQ